MIAPAPTRIVILSVCALPRTPPGKQRMYVRRTGNYMLVLNANHPDYGLPYGTYPRLILALTYLTNPVDEGRATD